jgi:DNA-binding response OmpR family regulator
MMEKNAKILVVDDSPFILEIIETILKDSGFEVITADDGEKALNKAKSELPDLMVLDLMLPKMNGYEVCKLLKSDEKYSNIPIIMLTARVNEDDEEKGRQAGANVYMGKPFELDDLVAKVRELLQAKNAK